MLCKWWPQLLNSHLVRACPNRWLGGYVVVLNPRLYVIEFFFICASFGVITQHTYFICIVKTIIGGDLSEWRAKTHGVRYRWFSILLKRLFDICCAISMPNAAKKQNYFDINSIMIIPFSKTSYNARRLSSQTIDDENCILTSVLKSS